MAKSWLEPYITSLLTGKRDILDSWRRQIPALSGRTKNFENWLLVELVDRVSRLGKIQKLRTNGNLSGKQIKAREVDGLSTRKREAISLSPDISILLDKDGFTICSEIKTGLAGKELLDDLKIVKHYKKKRICKQSEFVWVVLLPVGDIENRRSTKSFEKIYLRMQKDNSDLSFVRREITPWLVLVVAVAA